MTVLVTYLSDEDKLSRGGEFFNGFGSEMTFYAVMPVSVPLPVNVETENV